MSRCACGLPIPDITDQSHVYECRCGREYDISVSLPARAVREEGK